MKVIRKDRIIDLNKFDKVAYRKGTFWEEKEFCVDAVRQERNFDFFDDIRVVAEEIAGFTREEDAAALVLAIAEEWSRDTASFDVDVWVRKYTGILRRQMQDEDFIRGRLDYIFLQKE